MEFTIEQWVFLGFFFGIWFILSFIMLILYCMWEERKKNSYDGEIFTVKDIFLMILFAPFSIVCGIIYIIMWFVMTVLHFEDVVYGISDFMNKPLRFGKRKKDGQ